MDSGNSGSMNSSSGDEEYDSRTDHSIPSFLNPSLTHFGSSDPNPSDPSQLLSHHLFDLHPNPNNFLLNLDTTVRPRSALMRSDQHQQPQQPYHLGLMNNNNSPQSSSLSNIQQPLMFPGSSASQLQPSQLPNETGATTTSAAATSAAALRSAGGGGGSSSQTAVVRSSKKRTRASRRAPTTVLTTDTSNFRAMVQEFTGIPAPPFSASSPFSRRLDLLGPGSSSGIRSGAGAHLDGPLYPLVRPSAIKPQTSPFRSVPNSSSSSMFSNVMVDATNIATSSLNYPPPSSSDHHLAIDKQPMMRNMLNMHSQNQQGLNMAFQVQSLPLHPSSGTNALNVAAGFGATNKQPHEEMNVGHGYAEPAPMRRDEVWRVEGGAAAADMSCKMNYVAAAAPPNSAEINVPSRGEGTVDSWIFPSD